MRRLPLGIVVAIALLILYLNLSVFNRAAPASPQQPAAAAEPAVGTTAPATAAATFAAVTAPPRPAGPPMPGVLVALTKTVYRFVDERSYDCPALRGGKCDFTTLRSRFGEADAIIDVLKDPRKVKPLDFRKAKHQQLGVIISEQDKAKAGNTLFKRNGYDFEIGYNNKTADIWRPFMCNELSRKTNVTILEHLLKGPRVQPKLVDGIAAFVSNCVPWRLALLRELRKHVRLDSFGGCANNNKTCAKAGAHKCDKVDRAADYRFVFALENTHESHYVTEKVYTGLRSGAVPIYDGAPEILEHVPGPKSVVLLSDFGGDGAALGAHLQYLLRNLTAWAEYQQWDLAEFAARKAARQCPWQCRVCEMLSKRKQATRKEAG